MRIVVRGIPAPQGSKRHVGGGRMVEMSRAVGPWREAVRAETQRAMRLMEIGPHEGALKIYIEFTLPRPKSLPKKVVNHARRPDLDKLVRAVLDGLTEGGAWHDDGQVARIVADKQYEGEEPPGCSIMIYRMEEL